VERAPLAEPGIRDAADQRGARDWWQTYAINRFFGATAIHLIGCGLVSIASGRRRVRRIANPHGRW